jgi:hypothetical protein
MKMEAKIMKWLDVKKAFPSQWVLIEAIEAKTVDSNRVIESLSIIETFADDSLKAFKKYSELHKKNKEKEFYVVHTDRPELDISILKWTGVRPG